MQNEPLLNALRESELLRPGARVLAAVSGGPDSTALLIGLRECGYDLVAAHYDHALREGSELVAQRVATLCSQLGVRLLTERRTETMPKGSVQSAARELRYEFLDRAFREAGAPSGAISHTAPDLVAGAALHPFRGAWAA